MLEQTELEQTKRITLENAIPPVGMPVVPVMELPAVLLTSTTLADSRAFMQKLNSRNNAVRGEAERQLKSVDVPSLLSLMTYQRHLWKQRVTGLGIVFAINLVLFPLIATWLHSPTVFMFWSVTIPGLAVAAVAFTQTQKSIAMTLAQKEDLDAVGELIDALEMRDEELQKTVRPTLIRLLPRLRAQDAPLLNERNRRILRQFMEGTLYGGPSINFSGGQIPT